VRSPRPSSKDGTKQGMDGGAVDHAHLSRHATQKIKVGAILVPVSACDRFIFFALPFPKGLQSVDNPHTNDTLVLEERAAFVNTFSKDECVDM
jgi:hypothetical protein